MKLLACLVLLVLALPCAASGPPTCPRTERPKPRLRLPRPGPILPVVWNVAPAPPEPLISAELVQTILFPVETYTRRVADRIKDHRLMLENGGQGRGRGPYWPFLD